MIGNDHTVVLQPASFGSITLNVKQEWKASAKFCGGLVKRHSNRPHRVLIFSWNPNSGKFRGSFPQAAEFRLFIAQLGQYNPEQGVGSWAI